MSEPTRNERENFKKVFVEHYKPLCHLGLQYLKNEDEAKSAVQDAFLKLWENWGDLKPESNYRSFLFTLVKHNCLNILKHKQIQIKHHEKTQWLEMHYHYESLKRIGDDYMEFEELKNMIDTAIRNLPERCRVVFEMSRFENMKNKEIADKLGVTQKTVEAHLTKALKTLRHNLKNYLPLIAAFTNILN